jgi:tRNA pseudouridine55 synthase
VDGILNVNKPSGKTSFSLVARVKHLSREKRVGHAGTLDPQASGVLPICLGQGTRVIEYLFDATKTYRAEIELGVSTDTYDAAGKITRVVDASGIGRQSVEAALTGFQGLIQQIPPMFSALKHLGKPLYLLARQGIEIERKSRPTKIHSLRIVDWHPPVVTLEIICGKGTYIRSLAHDLGEVMGCGASLKNLIRLRVGPFEIGDALTLLQMEEAFHCGYWQQYLYPVDFILTRYPAIVVNQERLKAACNGVPLDLTDEEKANLAPFIAQTEDKEILTRVYTPEGNFLGIFSLDYPNNRWKAEKIFHTSSNCSGCGRCCENTDTLGTGNKSIN